MKNINKWSYAIAERIADEWTGKSDFPEDAILLQEVLYDSLRKNPKSCKRLINTGIIEEDYFEPIDF